MSEHLHKLKKSIAYNQALRIKQICLTESELHKHSSNLLQQLIKKGCHRAANRLDKTRIEH